jgi:polar amino acid transport system substrate-binding protein
VIASAEREAIIIPLLTRTAGREHKFRWIAPIYVDELTFHTVPPNPKIKDTAAARKVKSIGVRAGSSSDAYLHANDFDALMVEDSKAEHSAHKLALGRIDAWFTSKTMGRAVWTNEKLSHIPLQHGDTVSRSVYWIAASKHVAPEIIDKIAELFRRMNADGTYDRLFSVIDNE